MAFDLLARIQALRAQTAITNLGTATGASLVGANDGASGANFSTAQGFVDLLRSSQGAASIGFVQPLARGTNTGSTLLAKLQETYSVADFGARGDGVTDDTAAIQAAINAMVAGNNGARLMFPSGTYVISSAITIPFGTGWKICGNSRGSVTISQATNNTGIFRLTGDLTHSWLIEDICFTWASAQSATNTGAIAIRMDTGTSTPNGFFNFQIRRCTFNNGYRGICGPTAYQTPVWGAKISDCSFGGQMKGASVYLIPSPAIGQPNILLDNIHIDASGAGEATVQVNYSDSVVLRNVEWNGGYSKSTASVPVLAITSSNVLLSGCRSEAYTFVAGTPTQASIWNFSQTTATLIGCTITAANVPANGPVAIKGNTGSRLTLLGLSVGTNPTAGWLTACLADEITFADKITTLGNCTTNTQTYLGVFTAPKLDLGAKLGDFAEFPGDASKVLTGSSGQKQVFSATLTANRSVTLPNNSDNLMVKGMEIEIVRDTGTPGAFSLSVIDPLSGRNYVIPASTNGFVRYRYTGGGYVKMAAGTMS